MKSANGQLHAASSAYYDLYPSKTRQLPRKMHLFIFAWSWEVQESDILCTGALCWLASGKFPLCWVVFSATAGEIGKHAPKYRLWRFFPADVPAENYLDLRTHSAAWFRVCTKSWA
jgi:hypothetical protein